MRWSQMNNAQRAFLLASARWQPVFSQGQVVRHVPKGAVHDKFGVVNKPGCPFAQAIVTAKLLDRKAREDDKIAAVKEMQALVAQALDPTNKTAEVTRL